MRLPFRTLPSKARRTLLILSALTTVVLWFALGSLDRPLRTPAAPNGIVSFELAGSLSRSNAILASWDTVARVSAGLSLGMDYLFLVAYSVLLALLVSAVAEKMLPIRGCVGFVGVPVAWLQFVAGALDALENFALIHLLLGSTRPFWPPLARTAALIKFALVGAGFAYVAIAGIWLGVAKLRSK